MPRKTNWQRRESRAISRSKKRRKWRFLNRVLLGFAIDILILDWPTGFLYRIICTEFSLPSFFLWFPFPFLIQYRAFMAVQDLIVGSSFFLPNRRRMGQREHDPFWMWLKGKERKKNETTRYPARWNRLVFVSTFSSFFCFFSLFWCFGQKKEHTKESTKENAPSPSQHLPSGDVSDASRFGNRRRSSVEQQQQQKNSVKTEENKNEALWGGKLGSDSINEPHTHAHKTR